MPLNAAALQDELAAVCRDLPPESLERVLTFARETAAPKPDSDSEAERQRRIEAVEKWLSHSERIGSYIPKGVSVVEALYEAREERERALGGER